MNNSIIHIELIDLLIAFLPVAVVLIIFYRWSLNWRNAVYALSRMLLQLLIVGYFLTFLFRSNNVLVIFGVVLIMVFSASWIALRSAAQQRKSLLLKAFLSILLGGGLSLLIIVSGVLKLDPWYMPRYLIPLAGMVFANAMTTVSLCLERLNADMQRGDSFYQARHQAFNTALIPVMNSLFAVGLVSLPGMMTGQILSGVSPLIAVRYQIVVMCMIFASAGLSTATFLWLIKKNFIKKT